MTTDDDQKLPEQDSWAELEHGGADEKAEDFMFAFDALDEDPPPPADQEAAADIPLVVFPPPDAEVASADVRGGGDESDVIPMAAVTNESGADGFVDGAFADEAAASHDRTDEHASDDFDDQVIARELGLADLGLSDEDDDQAAVDAIAANGTLDDSADFGEPARDVVSDDVSFDVGTVSGESPFAENNAVDPWADPVESEQDHAASIPLAAALAGTVAATAAGRPVPVRKKRSRLGQMIGVGVGGLMALPIAYAISIWGFQQDPLKLGKQLPEQLAVLLPQKLQSGVKPSASPAVNPAAVLSPIAVSATEDLSANAEGDLPTADQQAATSAAEPADVPPVEPAEMVEPVAAPDPGVVATDILEPVAPAAPEELMVEDVPHAVPEPDALAAVDTATVAAPMASDSSPTTLPPSDPLAGLDALVADVAVADVAVEAPPAPVVAAPVLPLPDQTGVELAAERATHALEALGMISDPTDPERDRLLVGWYKSLAELGEQLATLEMMAADSGHPSWGTPAAAADLLDSISISEGRVADLDRLGRMWLTREKRRADGISLVAALKESRQVGPYWSTRVVVAAGNRDGTDRIISLISRLTPPADPGTLVLVSGVMFDGDAVWAADMRPIAPPLEVPEDTASPGGETSTP